MKKKQNVGFVKKTVFRIQCYMALAARRVDAPRAKLDMRGAVRLRCWQDQAEEEYPARGGGEEGQDLVPRDGGPRFRH